MKRKDMPFPKYAQDYFDQLRRQYDLLIEEQTVAAKAATPPGVAPTIPASIQELIDNVKAHPQETSWGDVFALETAYLYAVPTYRLSNELQLARDRYRDIIGADEYATYAKTVPVGTALANRTEADLRSELMTLAERIRYMYTFVPPKESVRNRLSIRTAWWTLGAALLGVLVYAITKLGLHSAVVTILVVMFVGQIGGFVSVQQRLQGSAGVDPLFKELQLSNGWFSVAVISPMLGMIFAIVLYFMFVGGLLSGGLFPHFGPEPPLKPPTASIAPSASPTSLPTPPPTPKPTPRPTPKPTPRPTPKPTPKPPTAGTGAGTTRPPGRPNPQPGPVPPGTCTGCIVAPAPTPTPCPNDAYCSPLDITQFLERAQPTALEDWGKLLVWAFIAGFAERFVPDALSRLTGQATSTGTPTKAPTSTPAERTVRRPDDGNDDQESGGSGRPRVPGGPDGPTSPPAGGSPPSSPPFGM